MDLHPELINVRAAQSQLKLLADQKRLAPIVTRAAAYLLATDGDHAGLEKIAGYPPLSADEKEFVTRAAEDIWTCFAIEEDLTDIASDWFQIEREEMADTMRLYFMGEPEVAA